MTLTRRSLNTERFESWGIYRGDLQVGTISSGVGTHGDAIWRWSCGFYPGCAPGMLSEGNQPTYDQAKAEFQKAWERLEPQISPAMADAWFKSVAMTAWKYAMRDAQCPLPSQSEVGRSRCFCGAEITAESAPLHVYAEHMPPTSNGS